VNIFLRDQRSECLWDTGIVNSLEVSISFFEQSEEWRGVLSSVHHGLFVSGCLVFDFLDVLIGNAVDSAGQFLTGGFPLNAGVDLVRLVRLDFKAE